MEQFGSVVDRLNFEMDSPHPYLLVGPLIRSIDLIGITLLKLKHKQDRM